jgi:hypothetical protein
MIALASFTNWVTAYSFLAGLGVFAYLVARHYDKHQHPEHDDRLSTERMELARRKIIREYGGED